MPFGFNEVDDDVVSVVALAIVDAGGGDGAGGRGALCGFVRRTSPRGRVPVPMLEKTFLRFFRRFFGPPLTLIIIDLAVF